MQWFAMALVISNFVCISPSKNAYSIPYATFRNTALISMYIHLPLLNQLILYQQKTSDLRLRNIRQSKTITLDTCDTNKRHSIPTLHGQFLGTFIDCQPPQVSEFAPFIPNVDKGLWRAYKMLPET